MTDQGFIKLHRSIENWEWYKDANTKSVFLHLLLLANWEDSRFKGHEVPKGSLVTSYKSIAQSLNLSIQNVRTAFVHLKSTGEITIKSTNKYLIVSVANWEKYQGYDSEANRQTNTQTNNQLTINQQSTNNIKEIKNNKNKKNYFNSTAQNGRNPDFIEMLEREVKNG